jgi:hypothetical protein
METDISVSVFLFVIFHSCLDGVFGQDGAMDFDRGQRQLLGDFAVLEEAASSKVLPLTHSVTKDEEAMAEPQP